VTTTYFKCRFKGCPARQKVTTKVVKDDHGMEISRTIDPENIGIHDGHPPEGPQEVLMSLPGGKEEEDGKDVSAQVAAALKGSMNAVVNPMHGLLPQLLMEGHPDPNTQAIYAGIDTTSQQALEGASSAPRASYDRGHKKSSWTEEEDRVVMAHVQHFGNWKWSKCAEYLVGRSGKQCRERWHNHLDPNINKNPWSDAEHAIFVDSHTKFGNQWALIAQFLPGRTDNAVKNRWNNMRAKATGERSSGKKKRKLADALMQLAY